MFQIKNLKSIGIAILVLVLNSNAPRAEEPFRLVTAERDRTLRTYFPQMHDPEIQQLLKDERLVLYTEREMPRAYQDWDGSLPGVHSAYYNISAAEEEPFGNGNREFPWGHPAGTHRCENVRSFRFFRLPQDEQGKTRPVVCYRKKYKGDFDYGYAWTFPVETVFGEVLQIGTKDELYYTFELRIRVRESGDWDVDAFRPFPTSKSLAKRIKRLRGNWKEQPKLVTLIDHLESKRELPVETLTAKHPNQPFHQVRGIDSLPEIDDDDLVAKLLTRTKFRSVFGEVWRDGTNASWTSAPTTDAKFHVVPAKYKAGFIEVDRQSCMRCHETTGQHVREFEFDRDWYGRVRGSDGIFSFHPFAKDCIGSRGIGTPVIINEKMVQAGIVAKYDPQKHAATHYQRIRQLEH